MRKKVVKILVGSLLLLGAIIAIGYYGFYKKNVNTKVDSYIYQLPFAKGQSYKVAQGYGGAFTHNGIAALDFAMPEGTAIHAARAGMVYAYKDNNSEGGISPSFQKKANYIMIKHDDGSYGCYWHLQKNGVIKKQGNVQAGELIGYSGNTGQSMSPHLHFSVKTKLNYETSSFIQTKFYTSNGIKILEGGSYYSK